MSAIRRTLFYFLVVVYCILCPMVVLYAVGYIFNPDSGQAVMKTGLISLSSVPSGASVYVNDKRFAEKTPTVIHNLLPGDYLLKVFHKGYKPWVRMISVRAEKAVLLDKILLMPEAWECRELVAGEFDNLIPIRSNRFFVLTQGPLAGDLFVYDLKERTLRPILPQDFPFKQARVLTYFLSDDGEQFLIQTQLGLWGEEKFFWVDPTLGKEGVTDVTPLLGEKPQAVDWSPGNRELLFSVKDGLFKRLDIASGAVYPKLMEKVRAFGVSNKRIYVLAGPLLQKMDLESKNAETLDEDPELMKHFLEKGEFYKIKPLEKGRILFLSRHGGLLINSPPYQLSGEGIAGVEPDPDSKKVLVWRSDKLGILDLSGERDGAEENRRLVTVDWKVEKAKNISQAFWVHENSHVLLRDGNQLYLFEFLDNEEGHLNECFQVRNGSAVIYSESSGNVYYLEKHTGRFCETTLVPKEGVAFGV